MQEPTFAIQRKKSGDGSKYVRIRIKKYEGKYLEIWVRKKGNKKFYRLKIKNANIREMKKSFNFSYRKQKGTLFFRLRTYKKQKGKRVYSKYSKQKKIRLR